MLLRDASAIVGILHIFPKSGFDQSTTTPVLVGVLIAWMFTEWFGWVFAGLVVPGYLAAVFLLDRRAAFIDVVEAVLTYLVARGLGEWLPRTGLTSRVFGRERFFLVVLSSILVRLAVEGVFLPRVLPHATWAFSIGLVVVPLTANACWKTGLARGAVQNGVPTLLTYLFLRFVLVPHTNLSLAGFELATENIEASFLASPKAYIILITGAVLAASANLRYGWDFNGILVPALLALVVIEPLKFVATFAEVGVLLVVTTLLLKGTPLGRLNTEGPRKTVLFFSIDYALRFAFAGLVGRVLPGGDVVELMGFGYLLPTLLAVKATAKGSSAVVLLPLAKVSLTAFMVGSLVGFAATKFDQIGPGPTRADVKRTVPALPGDPAAAALWLAALARPNEPVQVGDVPSARAIAPLVDTLGSPGDEIRARALGFEVQKIDHGVTVLRERFETAEGRLGAPSVLTSTALAANGRIVVLVPRPLDHPELAALAGSLLGEGFLDAVVIAGVDGASDRASQALARSLARAVSRPADGGVVLTLESATAGAPGTIRGSRALDLPRTTALVEKLGDWFGSSLTAVRTVGDADATLHVPLDALERWLAAGTTPGSTEVALSSSTAMALTLDGLAASETVVPLENLLVLRRLLLEPLLGATRKRSLAVLRFAAATLSYRIHGPTPLPDGADGLALLPEGKEGPIAVVARASGVRGTVIELPQGDKDLPRDLALRLGAALDADATILGLEPGGARIAGEAMRAAHEIAATPDATRAPAVVLVREAAPSVSHGTLALGSWGGGARSDAAARVKNALASLGASSIEAPLDDETRDFGARSIFGDAVLVAVTADPHALRASSLEAARRAARMFAGTGISVRDGAVGEVAALLASSLPTGGSTFAPADLLGLARRAALEESVSARRSLATALATTPTRAALARAANGEYLVIVGRDLGGIMIGASPTDPRLPDPDRSVAVVTDVAKCAPALTLGGACHVGGSP